MQGEKFWETGDVDMIDAWLTDLARVGYTPPPLAAGKRTNIPCLGPKTKVVYYPREQPTIMYTSAKVFPVKHLSNNHAVLQTVKSTCPDKLEQYRAKLSHNNTMRNNTLLIIGVNKPSLRSLDRLAMLHSWQFANILFCFSQTALEDSLTQRRYSYIAQSTARLDKVDCILSALEMSYRNVSYLYIDDKIVLNSAALQKLPTDRVWVTAPMMKLTGDQKSKLSSVHKCGSTNIISQNPSSDLKSAFMFHIPQTMSKNIIDLSISIQKDKASTGDSLRSIGYCAVGSGKSNHVLLQVAQGTEASRNTTINYHAVHLDNQPNTLALCKNLLF